MVNTARISRAYSEVYSFINALGNEYIEKIPSKVYNTIQNNRDKEYNPIFEKNQTIQSGMISHEALSLISALNLQYWCTDDKEKKSLKETYIENTKKEQEKYSYENMFKSKEQTVESMPSIQKQNEMIEYKEPKWYQKLFTKILELFKKK